MDEQYAFEALNSLKFNLEQISVPKNNARKVHLTTQALSSVLREILDGIESRELEWRAAFDAVQDPIFFHDQHYRIIRANLAYAKLAGMQFRDIVGKPYWQVFPKGDGPLANCVELLKNHQDAQSEEVTLDSGETYLTRGFAVKDEQGGYQYSVHILENITEQCKLRKSLEESTWRYQILFESAPDAILLADAETGRLLDANPAAELLTGRSREELLSLHQSQLHPANSQAVADFMSHVRAGLNNVSHPPSEIAVLHADGHEIMTEITARVFQLNDKPVIQGVFRDISARKATEAKMREHTQILAQIHDAVISVDLDGIIMSWNQGASRLFGHSEHDAHGKHISLVCPEEEHTFLAEQVIAPVLKKGNSEVEVRLQRKSGEVFFAQLSLSLLRDEQNDPVGIIGYALDISQRKQTEEQLNQTGQQLGLSLNLLKGIIESVPIRVFWKDRDLRYLGCNTQFANDAGFSRAEELIGKTDLDLGWTDQADAYRQDDLRVMESGVSQLGYEEPQTTPDGRTIWLRTSKVPLRNDNQEVIGILGIYDDITAQKKVAEELQLSENRLKEAQAVAHFGSWEIDLVKNELWWSDENHRIFGSEPGERNTYETFLDTVHPEDREFVNRTYTASVENHTSYDIDHRLLMADGSVKWVNETCKTFYDENGKPLRSAGTTLNITERKRSEAQASHLGRIINTSINEIYVFDANNFHFTLVNKSALHNLGYSMEEMSAMTPLDLSPELTEENLEALLASLRGKENNLKVFEAIHQRKDGSQYPIEIHLQYSALETPPVFVATILDITERHKANESLRRSEASLAEAQRIAQLGNWNLDIENNALIWSKAMEQIFEFKPQQSCTSYETFLEMIHPDDREQVDQAYQASVKNKTPFDIIHRLQIPSGQIKYVREMCETHYDEYGRALRSLGTVQDITEQYLTSQALTQSNRALKALSSCNSVLVHATSEDEILNNMCNVIIDEGGYRFAWIGMVEDDAAENLRPVAHAGIECGYLEHIIINSTDNEHGRGPGGDAIRLGKLQVVQDTQTEAKFLPWREKAAECGFGSGLALPLKDTYGRVFALFAIYAEEAYAFDDAALKLLQELADDLAFGILNLRTRDERDHYLQAHLKSDERHKKMLVDTIRAMSLTVEKRDPYTAGHQNKVAQLSVAIGRELGMDEDRLEGLRLGATIHDIGKIYVPAEILNRPGRLSRAEFEIIKSHAEVGYDIIKDVHFPWPVADMVIQHHERMDGSGYPRGLKGDEIILEARILAVADAVEAITSHRPYRAAKGMDKAVSVLEDSRGRLYDDRVVETCLRLIREEDFTFSDP